MNYFELIIVVSLFCLGLRAVTDNGMIGNPIRVFFQENFPNAGKPIVLCSTCMPSVWGTLIFWGVKVQEGNLDILMVPAWAGVCVSASFVCSFLWTKYQDSFVNTILRG